MAQNTEKAKKPRGPGRKWKPGQSGNPGGRPKSEVSITAILRRMAEERRGKDARTRAQELADKIWETALSGDRMTSEYLVDRLDGKAQESMALSGGLSLYEQGSRKSYDPRALREAMKRLSGSKK